MLSNSILKTKNLCVLFSRFYCNVIKHHYIYPPGAKNRFSIVLDNVFSEEECNNWIKLSEEKGYEQAKVNIGGGKEKLIQGIRNSSRCIIDNKELSQEIFNRIKEYIPNQWNGNEVSCINERLRFLKYDKGEVFKPHYDGSYIRECGSEESFITLQLYLNEGYEGGSTTFLTKDNSEKYEIKPKTGRILLFEHHILHESAPLLKGRKYACRTDIMYKLD